MVSVASVCEKKRSGSSFKSAQATREVTMLQMTSKRQQSVRSQYLPWRDADDRRDNFLAKMPTHSYVEWYESDKI